MTVTIDILFVADARFEGGTSTAVAAEMRAAVRAGLRCGLAMVKGPLLTRPFVVHPEIRLLLDQGVVERIDPSMKVHSRALLIHHPTIMEYRPTSRLRFTTDVLVVVLHHPMYDMASKRQYDVDQVTRVCVDAFGRIPVYAPVSGVVRDSLPKSMFERAVVLEDDWYNLIDVADWPQRPARPIGEKIVIGRHSRPDSLKWPSKQDAWHAYPPNGDRYAVRILGAGHYLTQLYGSLPANWELLPFAWSGVPEFLGTLDFYVYYHDDRWSEAFGRTILEALAVGLVVILPPHFERIFGDAAVYSVPVHVENVIGRFANDQVAYLDQCKRARNFAATTCSPKAYGDRIARLLERFSTPTDRTLASPALFPTLPARNILFISSNGIGIGHLSQQLAIARHLPERLRPVFATMSYSMEIAAREGYQAHFLTYHRHLRAEAKDWNVSLAEEVFDLIKHLRPAILAYDATAVFGGVIEALGMYPDLFSIWVRRPMWRESHRPFVDCASHFSAVIEPGELAVDFDHGPTAAERAGVLLVPPVLHVEPNERMEREAARAALQLPQHLKVVTLQLGSGSNFDMEPVRRALLEAVMRRPDTFLLDIRSPIAAHDPPAFRDHPRYRAISLFPSFRYSLAFDAAISAAGYNAFHEQILGAIPTLFVPNEADDMDLQVNRARWAELTGRGLLMRRDYDLAHVEHYVELLLDAAEQESIKHRCRSITWQNGAREIARYFEDHARLIRTDYDITRC